MSSGMEEPVTASGEIRALKPKSLPQMVQVPQRSRHTLLILLAVKPEIDAAGMRQRHEEPTILSLDDFADDVGQAD